MAKEVCYKKPTRTKLLEKLKMLSYLNIINPQHFRSLRGQLKKNPEAVENFLVSLHYRKNKP